MPFPAPAELLAQAADSSVVWVYLERGVADAVARPALGAESLARRARQGIPIYDNDAPLPDDLLRDLEDAGLRIRHRSRWLRAVSGAADAVALERIRALPFVARIAPVASLGIPPVPPLPDRAVLPDAAPVAPPDSFYGLSLEQVRQIGVPAAHDLGFTGTGVRVALLDTGFRTDHEALDGLPVEAARDFIQGDDVVSDEPGDPTGQDRHGTQVWSALAADAPGELIGPAYGAEFLLAKVDHLTLEPRADEDRWIAALEWADSLGAQVVNSSLGYFEFDDFTYTYSQLNGDSAAATRAADEAARRGILIVNSAGNEGPAPRTLVVPADADSILAIGAVNAAGSLASFSSRGPTADGRIKPDLVARGVSTWLAAPGTLDQYTTGSGTSFAAPLVAGGAALVVEAWPDMGAMAALRALQLSGSIQPPNDSMGHGIPNIASAILFPQGIEALETPGTGAGQEVATLAPSFAWSVPVLHPAARPVLYRLQVARDRQFADVVFEETVVDAQVLTLSRPLPTEPSLWWRVVAETAPGVVRTSIPVGPFSMPPWVRLVTLNDPEGVFVSDATPLLVWDPLPAPSPIGPLEYDVEIIAAGSSEVIQSITGITDTTALVTEPLPFNVPFRWRLIVRTAAGPVDTVQNAAPFVVVSSAAPPVTLIYQNFPNPFPRPGTSSTTIWFDVSRRTRVSLAVYDLRGRLVRRLIPDVRQGCTGDRRQLDAGAYGRDGDPECVATEWDGRTDAREVMPAGVYIIRLTTDQGSHSIRTLFRP
ncbi:MAG TPA: S8 family serine peptidase [Longimicrobiales bacterium]|nr:S8 family serine peptidase [Longimicrobiales bacterium]